MMDGMPLSYLWRRVEWFLFLEPQRTSRGVKNVISGAVTVIR